MNTLLDNSKKTLELCQFYKLFKKSSSLTGSKIFLLPEIKNMSNKLKKLDKI